MADYNSWERKVFDIFYSEISKYAANFKLLREVATQEKMEVYLKSTSSLLSNLVINIPSVNSGNIGAKRKLVENFTNASEAIGALLQSLHQPLSKVALMVATGVKETEYEDRLKSCLEDIFNLARYFKTLLHGDLPCYDDLISWAYDLRNCAFEMCCCEPCFSPDL